MGDLGDIGSTRAIEALSDAVGAVADELDVEIVLQLIVDRARGLVGAGPEASFVVLPR